MGFIIGLIMRFFAWVGDRLTVMGRFFEALFFGALDGVSRLDRVGRPFAWLFYQLTAPFRWVGERLRGSGESRGLAAWLVARLLWPFHALIDRLDRLGRPAERTLDEGDMESDERRLQARLDQDLKQQKKTAELQRSWVSRLGQVFMEPFAGVFFFFRQLLGTRGAELYLWGFPVALIVGLLGSVILWQRFAADSNLVPRYETALAQAIKAGDTDKAELYRIKLAQLGSATRRGEFQTALALAEQGKTAEAYESMLKLAPVDRPGMEGAHFWIAQNLINGTLGVAPPESLNLALKHLEHLKTRVGNEAEVRLLEGLTLARLGRVPAAINALTPIAEQNVVAAFILMEIYSNQGQRAAARQQALVVNRKLTQLIDEGQTLNEDQLKWRLMATRVIGDEKLAAESIEQWYKSNPDSEEARVNRTRLLVQEVARWCQQPNLATVDAMKQKMQEAANTVPLPQVGMVASLAGAMARGRTQSPGIAALYRALLDDASTSGLLLESFGTAAALQQDWATADVLLGRATEATPTWGAAWNNRAYVLSMAFPDRLTEALGYAERAVGMDEFNPDYRETRGMLNYKLKNFEAAIADLEIAMNGANDLKSVHAALADSHRRLGNPALAEVYERR